MDDKSDFSSCKDLPNDFSIFFVNRTIPIGKYALKGLLMCILQQKKDNSYPLTCGLSRNEIAPGKKFMAFGELKRSWLDRFNPNIALFSSKENANDVGLENA